MPPPSTPPPPPGDSHADSASDSDGGGFAPFTASPATERRRRRRGGGGGGGEEGERLLASDAAEKDVMYRFSGEYSDGFPEKEEEEQEEEVGMMQTKTGRARCWRFAGLHVVIALAFTLLLYGARRASVALGSTHSARTLSNGTHLFAPTTLLISLDGFRADFLARNLTPTLEAFIRSGVSPKYMLPSFPSLTFPNHFTLATGLYPEAHGIVGNTFFDPVTQKDFYYTDPARSMQPEWWNAEPFWLTAELAGVRTAIHMWPGSEAHIGHVEPTYVDEFKADEKLERKVQRVFEWLDLPGQEDDEGFGGGRDVRPQLIAAYVPDVDADGHLYGPNSTEIRATIQRVDGMLAAIFKGVEERNLTEIVNIIVVSDHGMATTSNERLIQLEDLIDTAEIAHIDGWPLYGLRPRNESAEYLNVLYESLLAKSRLPEYAGTFSVYLRDSNMPARYHFSANPRIAPLWLVPHTGWAIVTHDDFTAATAAATGAIYHPRGLHGYDHEHPLMRAIFVARGPAFPHAAGSEVPVFQNTEVYNLVCDSVGLVPRPNNGTLRLPLKTVGVHSFEDEVEVPGDDDGEKLSPEEPESEPEKGGKKEEEGKGKWWDWITGKLEAVKGWVEEVLNHKEKEEDEKGG